MKLLIASDIHGSAYYLEKLLKQYESGAYTRMVLLGDILYHGPRNDLPRGYSPKDVCAALNPLAGQITAVRGNCDAEIDQMVLDFPLMADYAELYADDIQFFFTHGHIYSEDKLPRLSDRAVFAQGHTHLQLLEAKPGYTFLNPGSTSIPKDGGIGGYAEFEGRELRLRDINGGTLKALTLP